ncbi:uncharacterized protein [Parasteatoda tepidariorum]|uniref:uncharacterized protein n=1 Tax=Parasteatoda tepidariorum TaxID=114398 RepID=UPI00077F816D|nr:uncharacterized protein LOC107457318 [Parasteatoda tepidariorum]
MSDKDRIKKYDYPSSETGGVRPLSIRGIFENEKYRLSEEFNDEERKWRKQWLKDQYLSATEPRPESVEWIRETRNPIRRMLSKPWQILEAKMVPVLGQAFSGNFRFIVPKLLCGLGATYYCWYYFKYNQNDWTRAYGPYMQMPKPIAFPGDDNFPMQRERFTPQDYDDRGFKIRTIFRD